MCIRQRFICARTMCGPFYKHVSRLAYIHHYDIRSIPCFSDDTLFAVKAPFGSTLEVPDCDDTSLRPDGKPRHEIQLSSRAGPIDVFLIQDPTYIDTVEETTSAHDQPTGSARSAHISISDRVEAPASASYGQMLKNLEFPDSGNNTNNSTYDFVLKSDEGAGQFFDYADVLNIFNLTTEAAAAAPINN